VLVSLPYVFLQRARHFGIFADWFPRGGHGDFLHVAVQYLSGNQMPIPLWFVPMIAVYYLFAPLFVAIDRHPRWYWLVPPLLLLASFSHRPQHQTHLNQSLLYFLPVYLSGMFVSHFREQTLNWVRKLRWPLLAVAASCVAFEVAFRDRTGAIESATLFSTERGVFDVNLHAKLILSIVCLDTLRGAPAWLHRGLSTPAEMSFGIFFVHYYFIYFARDLRVELGSAPWAGGILNLCLYTAVLVLLSMAFVWLIRRVAGSKSRYLVGS
jgi:surface polysaccharide O-acyltransferase-like enzyme